jgi:hypothetical protein
MYAGKNKNSRLILTDDVTNLKYCPPFLVKYGGYPADINGA